MDTISQLEYLGEEIEEKTVEFLENELLKKAEKLGFINENSIYYLKNLFIKYYNTVLFIFNKDKMIKMENYKDNIKISVINYDEVKGLECLLDKDGNHKLFFKINNTEECLDAKNDTDEEHIKEYNLIIQDILIQLAI